MSLIIRPPDNSREVLYLYFIFILYFYRIFNLPDRAAAPSQTYVIRWVLRKTETFRPSLP